jgi:hypothetical protein
MNRSALSALVGMLVVSTLRAQEDPPGWSAPKDADRVTTWALQAQDGAATLEVRCGSLDKKAQTILVTKESLLKLADSDGEIDIAFSFDGGKLEERGTKIVKGYHGVIVYDGDKYVKRLLQYDGKAFMLRVDGHGSDVVYNFSLAGGAQAKLGGACVK